MHLLGRCCTAEEVGREGGSSMTRDTREAREAREGAASAPPPFSDEELSWVREHMSQLRESIFGQRLVLQTLGIGFVLGLAAYVGGYVLKASATTEPSKLVADLLYALGWALWTGAIVALFVEVIPRAKRRQIKRALDAYEAGLHEKARSRRAQTSREDGRGRGRESLVTSADGDAAGTGARDGLRAAGSSSPHSAVLSCWFVLALHHIGFRSGGAWRAQQDTAPHQASHYRMRLARCRCKICPLQRCTSCIVVCLA